MPGTVRATTRPKCIGRVALFTVARPSSVNGLGSSSPRQVSTVAGGSAVGVRSWMALVISMPDMPSIAAWCVFCRRAKLPRGTPSTLSRPSIT